MQEGGEVAPGLCREGWQQDKGSQLHSIPSADPPRLQLSSLQGSPAGEHPASPRLVAAPLLRLQPLSLLRLHPGRSAGHSPLPPAAAPHPPAAAARRAVAGQGGAAAAGPGRRAVTLGVHPLASCTCKTRTELQPGLPGLGRFLEDHLSSALRHLLLRTRDWGPRRPNGQWSPPLSLAPVLIFAFLGLWPSPCCRGYRKALCCHSGVELQPLLVPRRSRTSLRQPSQGCSLKDQAILTQSPVRRAAR